MDQQAASHNALIDRSGIEARRTAIAVVMAGIKNQRQRLAADLKAGKVNALEARERNKSMPGRLGRLWDDFMDLRLAQQLDALEEETFDGMAWQSLMQCRPYLFDQRLP